MSGVTVGSRLDQLLDLQRAVEVHIEAERRTPTLSAPRREQPRAEEPKPTPTTALAQVVRVPLAAIPHKTMRDWANANGYPQYPRGPVTAEAVDAFIEAHR